MRAVIVKIGKVLIGGDNPIAVQSMCNTPTSDIEASVKQCKELVKAGADIIRLTTQGIKEVEALKIIKSELLKCGINTPLVADIHFSPEVAFEAAKVADKVRINPGNFSKDPVIAKEKYAKLIEICKKNHTAIRIGVNHGSLDPRIVEKYGRNK
jgi:(E)-4-hydroxy-3-methylbut-2-enyl-diphosphate synthase